MDKQAVEQQDMKAGTDGETPGLEGQCCPHCGYGGGEGSGGMGSGGMGGGMSDDSDSESESAATTGAPRSALDILDERFARSEIEKEEYIEKKALISQRPKPE